MSSAVTIGLDVGGTKVAGGLVTANDEVLALRERPTIVGGARDPGLAVTLEVARELVADARARGLAVDGIGAGFPEYVSAGLLRSHEVMAWTAQPAELLGALAPVTIESDVRCAALGEAARGVARGLADFCFVTVGTGISYALVEDRVPRSGARGEAIALGELEVSARIATGAAIPLERYASGEAIRQRFEVLSGRPCAGALEVSSLAAEGDRAADSVLRSAGRALGDALGTLVRLLDPGAVVLGGGVARASGGWRDELLTAYAARAASRPDPPPVLWAALGNEAGVIGAAIAHRRRAGGPGLSAAR